MLRLEEANRERLSDLRLHLESGQQDKLVADVTELYQSSELSAPPSPRVLYLSARGNGFPALSMSTCILALAVRYQPFGAVHDVWVMPCMRAYVWHVR
jgi:hypothetical protein